MLVYRFLGIPRSPAGVATKDVLSLGIYGKFWLYRVNREMDGHHGFHLHLPLLGLLVALPLVTPLFVKWGTFKRLRIMLAGHPTIRVMPHGWLFLISLVPILGTAVYTAYLQSTLNRYWFWAKREERIRLQEEKVRELAGSAEPSVVEKRRRVAGDVATLRSERDEDLAIAADARTRREARGGLVGLAWKGYPEYAAGRRERAAGRAARAKERSEERAAERKARKEEKRLAAAKRHGLSRKEGHALKVREEEATRAAARDAQRSAAAGPSEPPKGLFARARFRRPRAEGPSPGAAAPTGGPAAEAPPSVPAGPVAPREGRELTRKERKALARREKAERRAAARAQKAAGKAGAAAPKPASELVPGEREARLAEMLRAAEGSPAAEGAGLRGARATAPVAGSSAAGRESEGSQVTLVSLRCPRCGSLIEGVERVAGRKTTVTCGSCGAAGHI